LARWGLAFAAGKSRKKSQGFFISTRGPKDDSLGSYFAPDAVESVESP